MIETLPKDRTDTKTVAAAGFEKTAKRAEAQAERRAMMMWGGMVVVLLFGSVGMWIYAAFLAVSDPSMAIVPDYYQKGLDWDKHLAEVSVSEHLGWTVHPIPPSHRDSNGVATIDIFVRDKLHQPVTGLTGKAQLYHHARAAELQEPEIQEAEPGTYRVAMKDARPGTWQLSLELNRDNEHFVWNQPLELESSFSEGGQR